MLSDKFICEKCKKKGLFKYGICRACRKVNCVSCGKIMLSKWMGDNKCCTCLVIKEKKENNGIGV